MKIYVETDRLILREITENDVDGLFELDSDPEVHRYLGNNPVTNKEQIVEVIQMIRKQYIENGIGRWAIEDKSTSEFLGWTGLKLVKEPLNGHVDFYDVGYRLIRKHWGKGIATESAIASLKFGFETLGAKQIYASAEVGNIGSNNVLKKIGMQLLETFDYEERAQNWYFLEHGKWSMDNNPHI